MNKGDKFYCYKDVVMEGNGKTAYTRGKIYECDEDWNLPDDDCPNHTWDNLFGDEQDVFKAHFAKIGNYKGKLEGFPELIVHWMLKEQKFQTNNMDVNIFEKDKSSAKCSKGFDWDSAKYFRKDQCDQIINHKNFKLFFEIYQYGVDALGIQTDNDKSKDTNNSTPDPGVYYGGKGNPYEAIKVISAWGLNFNLGSAVKYIARLDKKDEAIKELKKAIDYLKYEIKDRGGDVE